MQIRGNIHVKKFIVCESQVWSMKYQHRSMTGASCLLEGYPSRAEAGRRGDRLGHSDAQEKWSSCLVAVHNWAGGVRDSLLISECNDAWKNDGMNSGQVIINVNRSDRSFRSSERRLPTLASLIHLPHPSSLLYENCFCWQVHWHCQTWDIGYSNVTTRKGSWLL